MNERISKCFAGGKKAITAYVTLGVPDMESCEQYIYDLIDAGVDILELGIPFSDPTADGAVIQEAGNLAISQGVKFTDGIDLAGRIRRRYPQLPIILFSYYNILFHYGLEKLKTLDVDGILAVDLPLEERYELLEALKGSSIELIPLISPSTPIDRLKAIAENCHGFIYYITVRGITGVRAEMPADLAEKLAMVRANTPLPVVAGFGISTATMAATIASHADGVVLGSVLVKAALDHNFKRGIDLIAEIKATLEK